MKKIDWCKKKNKGIKLVKPNINLSRAYLKKSNSSLNMLTSAIEKEEIDWVASTAYYAKYFAVYSLLMKVGIKCEIHDCTIELIDKVFELKKFSNQLKYSKKDRIDLQYYISEKIETKNVIKRAKKAYNYVLEMEQIINDFDKIDEIRNKLKNF